MIKFRKPRLGLAPRLALTIALIILSTILVDGLSLVIVPEPDVILMEEEWLADNIAEAQARLDSAAPAARPEILADLPSRDLLDFALVATPDRRRYHNELPQSEALAEILRRHLRPGTEIIVRAKDFPWDFNRSLNSVAVVVSQMPVRLVQSVSENGQEEIFATPHLDIHVSLADGTWLFVSQSNDDSMGLRLARNFAAPIFGILAILLISFWAAQRMLKPLRQIAAAAEKMGRERNVTVLPDMRIPEYKAIADSINDMQTRLKRFVDDRTQMLAAISHDLGTPLTRMRLLAEELTDPRQREQVLSDIAEMEVMIKTSLLFARDDAQQEPHVTVDLASLAISLCDGMSDAGQMASYHGPDHATLPCRPVAIRRALANLIDNGCKYGGHVTVTLSEAPDAVTIAIADAGPGIPENEIEAAFKPFHRLEASRNRATGGTGLGLTIARDIIHGHGGSLTLRNNKDGPGLTATVRLPKPGA
ncbi:sensor histidine kinase [Dongia sp.]|uniref:sensor histidine kinase n=1 Tax=Dongia sp. TaxID=1977262 RepID=UPI0035B3711E